MYVVQNYSGEFRGNERHFSRRFESYTNVLRDFSRFQRVYIIYCSWVYQEHLKGDSEKFREFSGLKVSLTFLDACHQATALALLATSEVFWQCCFFYNSACLEGLRKFQVFFFSYYICLYYCHNLVNCEQVLSVARVS